MPWPVILGNTIIVGLFCVAMIFLVHSDRRRKSRLGRPLDGTWIGVPGTCTTTVHVELDHPTAWDELGQVAAEAIHAIGGLEVKLTSEFAIGWTASPAMGFGWAPQEVAIKFSSNETKSLYVCSSRPRFAMAINDAGRNKAIADRLAREVVLSAGRGGRTPSVS